MNLQKVLQNFGRRLTGTKIEHGSVTMTVHYQGGKPVKEEIYECEGKRKKK